MVKPRKPRSGPTRRAGDDPGRVPQWMAEHPQRARLLLGLLVAAAAAAMMVDWTPLSGIRGLRSGDIAKSDFRANRDLEVDDEALTEQKRSQARDRVQPVFEYDVLLARNVQTRIQTAFSAMRAFLQEEASRVPPPRPPGEDGPLSDDGGSSSTAAIDPARLEEAVDRFERDLGVELSDTQIGTLQLVGWSAAVERDLRELHRAALSGFVVQSRAGLPELGGILVVEVEGSNQREYTLEKFDRVRDLTEARRFVQDVANQDFGDRPAHLVQAIMELAGELCVPNLRFDASATEVRRELAATGVQPVKIRYQKGQVIVRSGEPISDWGLLVVERMTQDARAYRPWLHHLALTALLLLFFALLEQFAARFVSKFRRRFVDLASMGCLLLVAALASWLMHLVGTTLSAAIPAIPVTAFAYAVPVAVGGIMVRTLMNSETSIIWAVVTGVVCATVAGGDAWLGVFYILSSLAAAGGVGHASERGRVLRAGFVAALANVALVVAMDLVGLTSLRADPIDAALGLQMITWHVIFALGGGLISGVLAVGLVPLFEQIGYLTDSKLLELTNLNHPLLRELIVNSPGTYHHSMVVGSLGEAAAEAIHANSLLVRVGAYFHDVGKMLKPQYFIENQRDGENPHDRLSPSMSGLVIISHVKEGIELARRYSLPEPLIDMIPQHHGTGRVSFFWNKAQQQADPDKEQPNESDYRYPGPKPQSKEAAIMMLADGVEAATRSLSNHSEGAIRARVSKIVNSVVADGQLEECPLTLKDLHTVSETFIQVLLGIHHHRIEYPAAPVPGKKGAPRGMPAGSITLEIPSNTPQPKAPHPLEVARVEREAARKGADPALTTAERQARTTGDKAAKKGEKPPSTGDKAAKKGEAPPKMNEKPMSEKPMNEKPPSAGDKARGPDSSEADNA